MAKKQAFGADAAKLKQSHRKMAKVIIPQKTANGKFSFKTAMVEQDAVSDYLKSVQS
jgi:hypothetical protein